MNRTNNHYYLIHIQYLGFRYHGWHKQVDVKTVQGTIEKTLFYVLGHDNFRTLGASRTDAGVSVESGALELFMRQAVDQEALLEGLNMNLPPDIRAIAIKEVDEHFNIIQSPKIKEYLYLFSFGEKIHPFCAPFMCSLPGQLDIEKMKTGAGLFEGRHNFRAYGKKPGTDTLLEREISLSRIRENDLYSASFFPKKSFIYEVHGKGFMRNQIRLMMGTLFALGKGAINLEELVESLKGEREEPLAHKAPAQGLLLKRLAFE